MTDTFACPSCDVHLKRSPVIVTGALVQCPRCRHEFTVPPEGETRPRSIQDRPTPPRPRPDFDEDTPPRPRSRLDADLSGNFTADPGGWIGRGQERWGEFLGPCIGFLFLAFMIILGLAIVPIAGGIIQWFVQPALMFGPLYAGTRVLRREGWEFSDFFFGFTRWWSLFVLNFFIGLLMFCLAVPFIFAGVICAMLATPGGAQAFDPAVGVIGVVLVTALGACAMIYFTTRWMFAGLLIIDLGMGVGEAMSTSWSLTRDKVLALFGFNILCALILLGGYLACCIGIVFAMPLVVLAHSAAYLAATGQTGARLSRIGDDIDLAKFGAPRAPVGATPPADEPPPPPVTDITDRPRAP